MNNEKLQSWALIAEIVGGIAIVISLGVVAFELNQSTQQSKLNTEAIQLAAYQELYDSVVSVNSSIFNDPDVARIIIAGQTEGASLDREDSLRISVFYATLFRHGDLAFYQFQLGMISEEQLISLLGPVRAHISNNATARTAWAGLREAELFQESFVEYIDELITNAT